LLLLLEIAGMQNNGDSGVRALQGMTTGAAVAFVRSLDFLGKLEGGTWWCCTTVRALCRSRDDGGHEEVRACGVHEGDDLVLVEVEMPLAIGVCLLARVVGSGVL
jgi:hypothetical protein